MIEKPTGLEGKAQADEMARWVKVPTSKPDDVTSIPGTHMVERHNQDPRIVQGLPQVHSGTPIGTHMLNK